MTDLYTATTRLFYQLSIAFFWPVAIALLLLLVYSLADLGALFVQMWRNRKRATTDLAAVARAVLAGVREYDDELLPDLSAAPMSPSLRRFYDRLRSRLLELGSWEHIDIWLEETLQREEIEVTSRLDRSRAFIRIGPMLGLAGTIIPLGPALQSLLNGNMGEMVNHLVIGFGAVVVGLMMSGVSYFITLVRERWARVELKEMENLCELLMRGLNRRQEDRYESFREA